MYNNLKDNPLDPIDLGDKEHLEEYAQYGVRDGVDVAQVYIDKYFTAYKGVAKFIKDQHRFAHKHGYVRTLLQRKRRLPDINSHDRKMVSYCERLSVNATIQGCKNYETPIITKEYGVVMLGEVAHQNLTVWDGKDFVKAMCLPSGKKKVVEITFSDNRRVICSPNHKYLCKNAKGGLSWKTPSEFSTSDSNPQMVVYNCNEVSDFECISPKDFPAIKEAKSWNTNDYDFSRIDSSFDLGYALGWLKSDGTVNPNKDISFLFAENKFECRDYLVPVLYKYFPSMYKWERLPEGNRSQILDKFTISSVNLARQASEMKVKSCIPSIVWKSKQALRGYIQACIDADGTVDNSKILLTLGKGNYYEDFAREFQQALSVFGIPSRLHFCSDRINVYIRKGACAIFRDRIGLKHPKKRSVLSSVKESVSDRYGDTIRVKSVEFKDEEVEMYDIVNSETHKFVADGLVTHNSASDITSSAQNRIDQDPWFEEHGCLMLVQVHDELVFECPEEYVEEAIKKIQYHMRYPFGEEHGDLNPVMLSEADFGSSYADAK